MLKMAQDEDKAFKWALNQTHTSVAARYARALAGYIARCRADEAMLSDPGDRLSEEFIAATNGQAIGVEPKD